MNYKYFNAPRKYPAEEALNRKMFVFLNAQTYENTDMQGNVMGKY